MDRSPFPPAFDAPVFKAKHQRVRGAVDESDSRRKRMLGAHARNAVVLRKGVKETLRNRELAHGEIDGKCNKILGDASERREFANYLVSKSHEARKQRTGRPGE